VGFSEYIELDGSVEIPKKHFEALLADLKKSIKNIDTQDLVDYFYQIDPDWNIEYENETTKEKIIIYGRDYGTSSSVDEILDLIAPYIESSTENVIYYKHEHDQKLKITFKNGVILKQPLIEVYSVEDMVKYLMNKYDSNTTLESILSAVLYQEGIR